MGCGSGLFLTPLPQIRIFCYRDVPTGMLLDFFDSVASGDIMIHDHLTMLKVCPQITDPYNIVIDFLIVKKKCVFFMISNQFCNTLMIALKEFSSPKMSDLL